MASVTLVGFLLTYDSRDVPANAYKGLYFDFRGVMYQKFLGGDDNFYRLELDYRQPGGPHGKARRGHGESGRLH